MILQVNIYPGYNCYRPKFSLELGALKNSTPLKHSNTPLTAFDYV